MKIIERKEYMDRLKRLRGTPDIKIITGMRRCGKSELLRSFIKFLKEENKEINIIHVDYANLKFDKIKDYESLHSYVESKYVEEKENVLLVDEVQLCNKFELAINSLHNSRKYDIYITGSNAFLMSSDLATYFTGRFIEIPVFPFSFYEYLTYFEIDGNYFEELPKYLEIGGLAGSYLYKDRSDGAQYIKDVYNTLIKRDLVDKYGIKEIALLDTVTDFLMDNVSNLTTANKIKGTLENNEFAANHVTIGNYLKYLCNAFMFYKVRRYDVRGKKYLQTNEKYYLVDMSMRYAIHGRRNMDFGRAYENLVAIELLRRGYEIYVGKLYEKEIDFVVVKNDEKIYIQVSDNISDEKTLARELAPLKSIQDAYPKILLANTNHESYDIDGIHIADISRWLVDYYI